MFFKTPRFIRRWLRSRMHPMTEKKAWSTKEKLSIAYMVIAWHCFGFVLYQVMSGKKSWPVFYGLQTKEEYEMVRPAQYFSKLLGIQNAEVYRISKLSVGEKEVFSVDANENNNAEHASTESVDK